MKVDLSKVILDMEKNPLKDEKGTDVILKTLCVNALAMENEESSKESGEDKVKRFKLFMRLNDVTDIADVTSEEVTLIKGKLAKFYSALAVGQAYDILEGN